MKNPLFQRIGLFCLLLLFSITLFRCSFGTQSAAIPSKLTIDEPFENVKVTTVKYKVTAEEGGVVTTESGTRISVPPNAFVDKNGSPVTGEVELSYREFHTPADIIASGIPMEYTHNGEVMNFESAGMFEMKCYGGASELEIAEGKSVDMQMASYKGGDNFNFYVFDTDKGQWIELNKDLAVAENQQKKEALAKIEAQPKPAQPIEPQKANENTPVLNLDVNYNLYPHMKEFNGLMWQYAGTDPANDPQNNPDIFAANWKAIDLTPADEAGTGSVFNLTIKTKEQKYTALIKPVLSGKNFEKAKQKFIAQREEYLKTIQAKMNEKERVEREGNFIRSLSVNKFGVYNCDRFYGDNQTYALEWDYKVDGPVDKSTQKIYHVCKSDNSVVYYYPNTKTIKFDPDKENYLIAILPDDKVAVFDYKDFKELKKKSLRKGASYTFNLKTLDRNFSSVGDLNQLLNNI